MKNKRRNGAQPETKSLFKGHGGFPIKQKGEAVSLSFALERHLWRPRSIACPSMKIIYSLNILLSLYTTAHTPHVAVHQGKRTLCQLCPAECHRPLRQCYR